MNPPQDEHSVVRRHFDLAPLGIPNIPCIGVNRFTARHHPIFHRHDGCREILFNFSGTCEYIVRGVTYALKSNDVLVVPPDTDHTIVEYPKNLHTFALLVDVRRKSFPSLAADETAWLHRQLEDLPLHFSVGKCGLKDRFARILDLAEADTARAGDRIALRTAILDLFLSLFSAARQNHQQPVNRRLQSLVREMEQHPETDYPLSQLVRDYGLSMNALIAQFRALTGNTPHAYLVHCRIERAKQLLQSHTSGAIARLLGFPSPQHFATQFKRETGMPPRAWRTL